MLKKAIYLLLILCLSVSLFGCKSNDYADDLPCSQLISIAETCAHTESGYEPMGTGRSDYAFGTLGHDDCALLVSSATENIDEIGIFHAPSPDAAKEISTALEVYLDGLLEEKGTFIASYAPYELEKLENAEVRRFGNYVAYAILSRQSQNAFFSALDTALSDQNKKYDGEAFASPSYFRFG